MLQLISLIGNRSATWLGIKEHLREAKSLRSKDWQRLNTCKKLCPQNVKQFHNNVPVHKTMRSLNVISSTVHNTIKWFRESTESSLGKEHRWKSVLDARDFRVLRQLCIKKRPDSVLEITAWAQEHFQKSLSVNTAHHAIHKCRLKLYHAEKKPYVNRIQKHCRLLWTKAHLKWTETKWKTALWSDGNHGRPPD